MVLVYNHCIKISNDFNKVVLHIVHKWIHLTHSYIDTSPIHVAIHFALHVSFDPRAHLHKSHLYYLPRDERANEPRAFHTTLLTRSSTTVIFLRLHCKFSNGHNITLMVAI